MMKVYVSIKLRCAIAKFDTMLWGLMRRAFTLFVYLAIVSGGVRGSMYRRHLAATRTWADH